MPVIRKPALDLRQEVLDNVRASQQAIETANIVAMLGSSEENVADRNVLEGEFVLAAGAAYVATRNIPRGATLVEGMNVVKTDISQLLNVLQQSKEG